MGDIDSSDFDLICTTSELARSLTRKVVTLGMIDFNEDNIEPEDELDLDDQPKKEKEVILDRCKEVKKMTVKKKLENEELKEETTETSEEAPVEETKEEAVEEEPKEEVVKENKDDDEGEDKLDKLSKQIASIVKEMSEMKKKLEEDKSEPKEDSGDEEAEKELKEANKVLENELEAFGRPDRKTLNSSPSSGREIDANEGMLGFLQERVE